MDTRREGQNKWKYKLKTKWINEDTSLWKTYCKKKKGEEEVCAKLWSAYKIINLITFIGKGLKVKNLTMKSMIVLLRLNLTWNYQ